MDNNEKPRIRVRAGTAADIRRELSKTADKISDLMDTVDVPLVSDQWNVADHGNRPRTPTGPAESMSGSGSERMIEHYSPDAQQPDGSLAAAYSDMAAQLSFMHQRMAASEAAIKSIATWLAQQAGVKSFPSDETPKKGSESDEKDPDDKDDDDEAAKSIPTLSVPGLMRSLAGASRDTGKVSLQSPPDLAVVRKTRTSIADVLDQDDGSSFSGSVRMELASIQAAMNNLDGGMMRSTHLNNLLKRSSEPAREVLMKAGISF